MALTLLKDCAGLAEIRSGGFLEDGLFIEGGCCVRGVRLATVSTESLAVPDARRVCLARMLGLSVRPRAFEVALFDGEPVAFVVFLLYW